MIRIRVRFSIPSTTEMAEFKRNLIDTGFSVEEITPGSPVGQEVAAYVIEGLFHGDLQDLFTQWRRASTAAAIEEALLTVEADNK